MYLLPLTDLFEPPLVFSRCEGLAQEAKGAEHLRNMKSFATSSLQGTDGSDVGVTFWKKPVLLTTHIKFCDMEYKAQFLLLY